MKSFREINYPHSGHNLIVPLQVFQNYKSSHFQFPPNAETKLIKCISGVVFDVIVDLREGSPTFGQWHAEKLDGSKQTMICIPAGFAHGFQTLTPNVEMLYFHSTPYRPEYEGGLRWNDETLKINWPLELTKISARDAQLPFLSEIRQLTV